MKRDNEALLRAGKVIDLLHVRGPKEVVGRAQKALQELLQDRARVVIENFGPAAFWLVILHPKYDERRLHVSDDGSLCVKNFGQKGEVIDTWATALLVSELARAKKETVLEMISRLYTTEESPTVVAQIYDMLNGDGYVQPIISGGMVRLDLHLNASGGAGFHIMSTEGTVVIYDKSKSEHAAILDEEVAEAIFGQLRRS
jgi:hypothetical protein